MDPIHSKGLQSYLNYSKLHKIDLEDYNFFLFDQMTLNNLKVIQMNNKLLKMYSDDSKGMQMTPNY